MSRTTTYLHVEDSDPIRCQRKATDAGKPYYALDVGTSTMFLNPADVARVIQALAPVAEEASADCQPKAEAA